MGVFSDPLRHPEQAAPDWELEKAAAVVCSRPWNLRPEDRARLLEALQVPVDVLEDDSINIAEEVRKQCALVSALRSRFLDPDGSLRTDTDLKEAQGAAAAFNSFLNAYLKAEEKVNRFERLSHIETAVIEAIKELPESAQEVFFNDLENRLG